VVISDLHDPNGINSIKRLAGRHDCMVAHMMDPYEGLAMRGGFCRAQEPETGRDLIVTGRSRLSSALWGGVRSSKGRSSSDKSRSSGNSAPRAVGEIGPELIGAGADYALLRTDLPILEPLRHLLEARGGAARKNR
jgi:hypothetical protein